jgi:energy-coupling factor transport system substrate-specific component
VVIGWGVDVLGLIPFAALGNIIFINNFIVSVIIGPFLLAILYPRVKGWGLIYPKIMGREEISTSKFGWLGVVLAWIGGVSGLVIGNLISIGVYNSTWLAFMGVKGEVGLFLGLLPSIILIILSSIFL